MNGEIVDIRFWQLGLALIFVVTAGTISLIHGLGLARDLAVGTVRTFVQLFLLGYVLVFVFTLDTGIVVVLIYAAMIAFAAWTIHSRVKERQVAFFVPTLVSMLASYMVVSVVVCAVMVGVEPWWKPQYFLPLGGMVVGNSMNAIAITLDRMFGELRSRRDEVEMMLSLGADYREASHDVFTNALKAGMIPSINSMMAVGMVFIPGMMTGQILAGADPLVAVRYQIVVMTMLVGSTALGSLIVAWFIRRRCFGEDHVLKLR
ncbi:MAG: ABC transporter permease [Desulfatibacillaceae bacterium]